MSHARTVILGMLALAASTRAEDSSAADLSAQATDPTASLMSFNFQGSYTGFQGDLPGEPGDAFQFAFKPVIPLTLFDTANLFRLNLPFQTGGRGDEGFGQITLLDVFLIPQDWGRLGVRRTQS